MITKMDTLEADRILGDWGSHEEGQGRALSDGTIDEEFLSDDFDSNSVTLTYDDKGNLTFDGLDTFVYDAWNRLRN